MILCLTPNPALDVTYTFDHLRPGESHRVPAPVSRAGGKGVNVARVCHAQGYPTRALITSRAAPGEPSDAELRRSGSPHHAIAVAAVSRHGSAPLSAGGRCVARSACGGPATPAVRAAPAGGVAREAAAAGVPARSACPPPLAPGGSVPGQTGAGGDGP